MTEDQSLRKLLIVDDDEDDRNYFIEAVSEIDSSILCVTAKDGQQAMEMLTNENLALPNIIFLDLRMPKVNGRQCLARIKADNRLSEIPVIVYTTSAEVAEANSLQQFGAVRFVTKPGNTDEIYYVVSQALEEMQKS